MKIEILEKILNDVRKAILNYSGNNPDTWFYANRFVFARLQLDERRTKNKIKKKLFQTRPACHYKECPQKKLESLKGIHLHRQNRNKGYCSKNCVLVHSECHKKIHKEEGQNISTNKSVVQRKSKKYNNGLFLYWWDLPPNLVNSLASCTIIEFVKKDCGESCFIPFQLIRNYLAKYRQTSRGSGNWGVKVLLQKPNELAIEEPKKRTGEWKTISVGWGKINV